MRRRSLLVAKCKAFCLLAGTGAEQQGLRRKNALVPNAPIRRSGGGTSAPCCRHRRAHRHRARRLLQATFIAHRQGQGSDRRGPQDRSPLLQCRAIRNGLCRSRGLVLRDALPGASGQQFAAACQVIRLCSPALGAESRCCRFLGIVMNPARSNLKAMNSSMEPIVGFIKHLNENLFRNGAEAKLSGTSNSDGDYPSVRSIWESCDLSASEFADEVASYYQRPRMNLAELLAAPALVERFAR